MQAQAADGRFIKADANSQPHAGTSPQTGGGGKSLYLVTAGDNDGTSAQKADAADDLSTQTGGVRNAEGFHNILIGHDGQGQNPYKPEYGF